KCLEKDPKKRLRDISGVELLLFEESTSAQAATPSPAAGPADFIRWAVAAALALSLAVLAFVHFRQTALENQALQYTVPIPEKASVQQFAISPDGRYLVLAATGEHSQLLLRAL